MRCGIATGTTSSSKTPFFQAAAAFWCDAAANSSCSSRVRLPPAALHSSVSAPIACWVTWSKSASYAIESTSVVSPYLKPSRDFGSRCGALVIDSMPPATTISTSPARISWSAIAIALRPERQTLLIVIDGTSSESAGHAGGAGGVLPGAGQDDLAHDQVVDLVALTPAFSRAPLMATPPRSAAERSLSPPSRRPIGVRAPATMTVNASDMEGLHRVLVCSDATHEARARRGCRAHRGAALVTPGRADRREARPCAPDP